MEYIKEYERLMTLYEETRRIYNNILESEISDRKTENVIVKVSKDFDYISAYKEQCMFEYLFCGLIEFTKNVNTITDDSRSEGLEELLEKVKDAVKDSDSYYASFIINILKYRISINNRVAEVTKELSNKI